MFSYGGKRGRRESLLPRPTLGCRARRHPADFVEADVLASISWPSYPPGVIDAARIELRKQHETPEVAVAGHQRARLMTRLEQLTKQQAWGYFADG
jgi:hypothetical protein